MKAGGYTFMDYVKVGLPLQIIIGVVMTFVLRCCFPLLNKVIFFLDKNLFLIRILRKNKINPQSGAQNGALGLGILV